MNTMKLRHLTLPLLALTAAAAWADPLKFNIYQGDQKIGTLSEEITGDDESGYVDESTMILTQEDKKVTISEIVRYDKTGTVTSKNTTIEADGHTLKLKAKLSDAGAKVSAWADDDKRESEVPLATKTTRADVTNFWFKKSTPKIGDVATYQGFDLQEMTWSDITFTYKGKKTVKLGEKSIEGHELERKEGEDKSTCVLDEKGDALLVDDGHWRFERVLG